MDPYDLVGVIVTYDAFCKVLHASVSCELEAHEWKYL